MKELKKNKQRIGNENIAKSVAIKVIVLSKIERGNTKFNQLQKLIKILA